ncbi:hypothetical protein STRCR_1598 [Streptococcus criceti HS-6]|uniref:Uncharacterized protein n=1 Tax=Streptococcus criceti HS-6 TaxID=873449 RepID=G5JPE6_STRCG|nr:hypothetical protein STRCR_1598 [Streptococcus criceti HS-6]
MIINEVDTKVLGLIYFVNFICKAQWLGERLVGFAKKSFSCTVY